MPLSNKQYVQHPGGWGGGAWRGNPYPFSFFHIHKCNFYIIFTLCFIIYQSIFHVSFILIHTPSHFFLITNYYNSQVKETEINEALL